jgi:hypothetical protein
VKPGSGSLQPRKRTAKAAKAAKAATAATAMVCKAAVVAMSHVTAHYRCILASRSSWPLRNPGKQRAPVTQLGMPSSRRAMLPTMTRS